MIASVLIFGCGRKPDSKVSVGTLGDTSDMSKSQTSNGDDFDTFFVRFASDSIFQKKHVLFPLENFYSDEDFPLDMMENPIYEEDYAFVDFSGDKSAKALQSNPYKIEVQKESDSVFYRQLGIGNYRNITYTFARNRNSWQLVEIKDLTD
ncbi:MAG: DUF4348 domain-containing protein [Flavobacterium sp.]|nr:MAG: DUF4348 domain-containing protein [Flavobacterium sp.]